MKTDTRKLFKINGFVIVQNSESGEFDPNKGFVTLATPQRTIEHFSSFSDFMSKGSSFFVPFFKESLQDVTIKDLTRLWHHRVYKNQNEEETESVLKNELEKTCIYHSSKSKWEKINKFFLEFYNENGDTVKYGSKQIFEEIKKRTDLDNNFAGVLKSVIFIMKESSRPKF